MKRAERPEDLHTLFAEALNSRNLEALTALYSDDSFFMAQRSVPTRGAGAIREAFVQYLAMNPSIRLTTRQVVQVRDTALLVGEWEFRGTSGNGAEVSTVGTSIEVARREPDGSWRYLIDLPNGPLPMASIENQNPSRSA